MLSVRIFCSLELQDRCKEQELALRLLLSKEVPFQGGRADGCTVWIFPLTSFVKDVGNDVSDAIASHTSWLGIEADNLTQKPSATSIAR